MIIKCPWGEVNNCNYVGLFADFYHGDEELKSQVDPNADTLGLTTYPFNGESIGWCPKCEGSISINNETRKVDIV